ncbi:hypothetical protein FRC08_001053 [Ceratobasidium sp. 394]|nr:hypothetical protein FRC08_001053 [Ceratobasidium sp. 394]
MSDLSNSPPPVELTASTSTKRKSTANPDSAPKKKRTKKTQPDPFANAKEIVQNVLASPDSFAMPKDDAEVRGWMLSVAQYAKSLEGSVAVAGSSGQPAPPPKTPQQIQAEVERIADMVNKGIRKQMSWKPSCKHGGATYAFDGVCPDPRVFGALLKLDGPPKFKMRKYPKDEFQDMVGDIEKSVRYDTLYLTSDVNVRYNPDTGEFKTSGSYGVTKNLPSY